MSFYAVSLNGKCAGQDVVNVLWYRNLTPFADAEELFGLLDAINGTVRDQIWESQAPLHARGVGLKEVMPGSYTLESISTVGYNDDSLLISDTPAVLSVNEAGGRVGETNGPAACINLRANLEPSIGPGVGLPKRGYLAIGPHLDNDVDITGHLTTSASDLFADLAANLATNIVSTAPACIFAPIRVRVRKVAGVTLVTYKDISNFTVGQVGKFRKSRLPEA